MEASPRIHVKNTKLKGAEKEIKMKKMMTLLDIFQYINKPSNSEYSSEDTKSNITEIINAYVTTEKLLRDTIRRRNMQIKELKKKQTALEGGLKIHNEYLEEFDRLNEFNNFINR